MNGQRFSVWGRGADVARLNKSPLVDQRLGELTVGVKATADATNNVGDLPNFGFSCQANRTFERLARFVVLFRVRSEGQYTPYRHAGFGHGTLCMRRRQGPKITILFFIPQRRQRNRYGERVAHRAGLVGREGHTVRDVVLKYPIWQVSYRAAVIEGNPKLLEQKIATAAQAVKLRFKELENSTDHHHEVVALTDALTALKILAETNLG